MPRGISLNFSLLISLSPTITLGSLNNNIMVLHSYNHFNYLFALLLPNLYPPSFFIL